MNYYRNIDLQKIQFDFLVHHDGEFDYDDEIRSLGGKIYHVPAISFKGLNSYIKGLEDFFSEQHHPIVHSHMDALSAPVLRAAKKAGVPVRIAHSHNNGFQRDKKMIIRYAAKQLIPLYATEYWACSRSAAEFMFGSRLAGSQHTELLPNAISCDEFAFSEEKRSALRHKLGLSDRFVVGNIGRLSYQKNQEFLLEIFKELIQLRSDSCLLLVGSGEDEPMLKDKADRLGITNFVRFLGTRDDIPFLLSAMDVMVFPSRFEGFGIALLEAQASGLHCVASDKVANEIKLTDSIEFLPLEKSPAAWAAAALRTTGLDRSEGAWKLKEAGYDIGTAANALQKRYLELAGAQV